MKVKSKADSAIAPIINVGATYDFNESWYAVGSLSYAKLDSDPCCQFCTVKLGRF